MDCRALWHRRGLPAKSGPVPNAQFARSPWIGFHPNTIARNGFTILELVVAIAVVGLLAAILIPAVSSARETARRAECQSHLKQIGAAMHAYEGQHGTFPTSLTFYELLPYLDQTPFYEQLQQRPPWDNSMNWDDYWGPAFPMSIPLLACPSDPAPTLQNAGTPGAISGTNYAGNLGNGEYARNGFFFISREIRASEISDGLSQTAAMAEILRGQAEYHRLRTIWDLPRAMTLPDELELLADACEQLPGDPRAYGYSGDPWEHGYPWFLGHWPYGHYHHILPPNRPSCTNDGAPMIGALTAGSMHGGGAHVLFADGHVGFVSENIDRRPWRDMGSRGPPTLIERSGG